jgi:hypothetical protein
VLGHWVGKIMSFPTAGNGTTSALLTGNAQVSGTGADSSNQAGVTNASTANINQESVGTITNNVNVNAQSGDAEAYKNTNVGNVATGDAKASSAVANLFNTVLNVKNWFGVLVINVFGDWTGAVNENTEAGTQPQPSVSPHVAATVVAPQVAAAVASQFELVGSAGNSAGGTVAGESTSVQNQGPVLTAAAKQAAPKVAAASKGNDLTILFALSAGLMLIAGALASVEKRLKRR